MSVTLTEVLSRFDNPVRIAAGKGIKQAYNVKCPCHRDKQPSLTISESESGNILFHDHAGCKTVDILSAIGLSMNDISGEKSTNNMEWKTKIQWYFSNKCEWTDNGKKRQGYGEGVRVTAEYRYYDESNNYQYSKVRLEGGEIKGKLIRYYTVFGDTAKACKLSEVTRCLYNLPEFLKLKDKAQYVYIVEGEKDCETLRKLKNGFACCVTPGGAQDWRNDYAHYFKGRNVIIFRDNDEAGIKAAERILSDILPYAFSIKIVNPSKRDHGDVTDFLTLEGGTTQSLRDLCNEVKPIYAPWVKTDGKGNASGINSGRLAETISEHEDYVIDRNHGDDRDIFKNYEKGAYKEFNRGDIKALVREYIPASFVTDNLLNNVCNLLFATNDRVYCKSDFDTCEGYVNFKDGLLDIKSKPKKIVPHNPEILSTIQFPFNYDPRNDKHPVFDKYIRDLCTKPDGSVDEGEIAIIQEYMGFVISNVPMSKIKRCMVLWSRQGNTGKSVLIRLITSLIGIERTAPIKLNELNAEHRFILGKLPGSRLITCGDESNSNVNDSSIFKSITGGDPVKIEPKGKQGYPFIYRGGFIIACNGLPCFVDDKDAVLKRLLILPCEHYVSDEVKDADLDKKLQKEIIPIMNWCLEGLYRLIDNRYVFSKSESSIKAMEEYRSVTDNVYRFLREYYIITGDYNDRISKKDFDDQYHTWASKDNTIKEVDRKNLAARMEFYGVTISQGNAAGHRNVYVYRNIKEKPVEFEEVPEDIPFT